MLKAYIRVVRPLCCDQAGLQQPPSLDANAPLFVSPRTGRRITKLSRHLTTFFVNTTGLRLTTTRLRQMWHTYAEERCSQRALASYTAADTHSGKTAVACMCMVLCIITHQNTGAVARQYYLKRSAASVTLDASTIHRALLADVIPPPPAPVAPAPAATPVAPAAPAAPAAPSAEDTPVTPAVPAAPAAPSAEDTPVAPAVPAAPAAPAAEDTTTTCCKKRKRVPWSRTELLWLRTYLLANRAATRSTQRSRQWVKCKAKGAHILLPMRTAVNIKDAARTLQQGGYKRLGINPLPLVGQEAAVVEEVGKEEE